MPSLLLPREVNNRYEGNQIALLAFIPLVGVTIARSLIHILRADGGAQSIATIPLDSYAPAASGAVITIFALWGLSQLLLGLLYMIVLLRYRALVPLMYLTMLIEYLGRIGIGLWKPLETLQTPPGARLNIAMVAISMLMLTLSLRQNSPLREAQGQN
jgi:hypothetical protein